MSCEARVSLDSKGAGREAGGVVVAIQRNGSQLAGDGRSHQRSAAIKSRDLDPTRFSDAGEDGGDFFHRILPFAENAVQSGVGDCNFHVKMKRMKGCNESQINSSMAVVVAGME